MIISHRHKFIFVKTRKTAGTSIEISLSRYCGEEDILTPFEDYDERKYRSDEHVKPRNYKGLTTHSSVRDAIKVIGREKFDDYFKFCVERNPVDKVVSYYWHWNAVMTFRNKRSVPFEEFMQRGSYKEAYDYPLYTMDGKVCVDRVLNYSNLDEELAEVCATIGIPFDGWLPRAKGEFRKDRSYPELYYSSTELDMVERQFEPVNLLMKEIELHKDHHT